jgi:hypothetical protein
MTAGPITNYTTLQTALADYLVNMNVTTQVQLFIQLAEEQFNMNIRNRLMLELDEISVSNSTEYYALPSDWLETRRVTLIDGNFRIPLSYATSQQIEIIYRNQSPGWWRYPGHYTITSTNLRIAPVPSNNYIIEMEYFGKIPSLSTNGTNWLITSHPSVYLYGSLTQAIPYMLPSQADGTLATTWSTAYAASLTGLESEEKTELWNGAPLSATYDGMIV